MTATYGGMGLVRVVASTLSEVLMDEHTPARGAEGAAETQGEPIELEVAAYMLNTTSVQMSNPLDPILAQEYRVPAGSRVIQLQALLPPGLLDETQMTNLLLPNGQATNPLNRVLVAQPQLQIVVRASHLTDAARAQLYDAQAEDSGAEASEPPMPDLLAGRMGL